jgi:hypothetical protein
MKQVSMLQANCVHGKKAISTRETEKWVQGKVINVKSREKRNEGVRGFGFRSGIRFIMRLFNLSLDSIKFIGVKMVIIRGGIHEYLKQCWTRL